MKTDDIIGLITGHLTQSASIKVHSTDNPLEISTSKMRLALYIRKITSAYFKNRPDVSRVQLHDSQSIKNCEKRGVSVLVVGYCPRTDSVIIWPPESITSRFNKRNNVSLYSRFSFQLEAGKSTMINSYTLSNGDVVRGSNLSAIADVIRCIAPQVRGFKSSIISIPLNPSEGSHISELNDSDALKKIIEDNPQFTFADAVEYLRSNRKSF